MGDIKLKPRMNTPKVLVKNYAVKEAESILKAKYKAQQEKREQIIRDPVREATRAYRTDRTRYKLYCSTYFGC